MKANGVLDVWQGTAAEFDKSILSAPPDTAGQFHDAAIQIESAIKVVYRMTAVEARNTDDMEEIARLWGAMAQVCQEAVKKLAQLVGDRRDCGVGVYIDRILDLANKCQRLQTMHQSQ